MYQRNYKRYLYWKDFLTREYEEISYNKIKQTTFDVQ